MDTEFDYDLTPNQWETLKALRKPAALSPASVRRHLESLVALELVAMHGNFPVITDRGRKVLIRGSSRLLDVAA
jgi:predicted ArsR family transcriptional regulator